MIDVDPQLVDPQNGNFNLAPGSPAIASGKFGYDRGGRWFSNRPQAISKLNMQTPDLTHAHLSWRNPTSMLDGSPIGGLLTCRILRNGQPIDILNAQTAGDSLNFSDTLQTPGNYQYTVSIENEAGQPGFLRNSARFWGGGELAGVIIWNMDADSSSATAIKQGLQQMNYNKYIFECNDPHEYELTADIDAVFVLLGAQPNYYFLGNGASNRLIPYLLGGGNVYLEGADFWSDSGQQQLAVHQFFYVNPIGPGSTIPGEFTGQSGTLMSGLHFAYSAIGQSYDDILGKNGASLIMYNPASGNGGAVACTSPNYGYKTIAGSFRLGKLQDGVFPSTRNEYVKRIMNFFTPLTNIQPSAPQLAENFSLLTNYPNPFNGTTTIYFNLRQISRVRIEIFNLLGQLVRQKELGRFSAGNNARRIDLNDMNSGIYFYKLIFIESNSIKSSQLSKLILLK